MYNLRRSSKYLLRQLWRKYHLLRTRNVPLYKNPNCDDFAHIEASLSKVGVEVKSLMLDRSELAEFHNMKAFPSDYHGGKTSEVWDEKLLEHFVSFKLLGIKDYSNDDTYVDVAACSSPWARYCRAHLGVQAYAIDLNVPQEYQHLSYYMQQNATNTDFSANSVRGISLHCAYEMFVGDDDVSLISELSRILVTGGKCIIVPLYMHTHYCHVNLDMSR